MRLIARLNLAINEQSEKFWYGTDDKRERESLFFCQYTCHRKKKTITHTIVIALLHTIH